MSPVSPALLVDSLPTREAPSYTTYLSANKSCQNSFPYGNTQAFQVALVVKNLPANEGEVRDVGSISRSERFPGGGHGSPFPYSCLENPMDRGAWWATVHRVTQSLTQLNWLHMHAKGTHDHHCCSHRKHHPQLLKQNVGQYYARPNLFSKGSWKHHLLMKSVHS